MEILGLSFDFTMFSFVMKFGDRPFVVFNVVCWRVIIQHYQIVFKIVAEQLAVWWLMCSHERAG